MNTNWPSNRQFNLTLRLLVPALMAFLALTLLGQYAHADSNWPAAPVLPAQFCDEVSEIPTEECEALVSLYQATGGDDWYIQSGWLQTNTPCNWYGVGCLNSHVYDIYLYYNGLTGTIPTVLDVLTHLESLNLSDNQLGGEIPPELGSLAALKSLFLNGNQLGGSIPPELGRLANLEWLDLGGNQLIGDIPVELQNLDHLTWLGLAANQFSGSFPTEILAMTQLELLYLGGNQYTGSLPAGIGALTNLRQLSISYCQFSGDLPPELGNLVNLQELDLSGNQFSGGLPSELGQLHRVNVVNLSNNQLSGSLPAGLGNMQGDYWLRLDLSDNQLSGEIPPEIGNIAALSVLDLHGNQLSGNIPAEIGSLISMYLLDLSENQLSGGIPPALQTLDELWELNLSGNQLSGSIPTELEALTNLANLNLSGNQLTGSIPPWLGMRDYLREINISRNQLSGSLPDELSSLQFLRSLRVQKNALTGEIPPAFSGLSYLYDLDLGYNALWAADTRLNAYLDDKDPDWQATQTLPPSDLAVSGAAASSLEIAWQPIQYTQDGGYYEISWALDPAGPFSVHGQTADKTSASYTADSPPADVPLYFRLRTYTPAHGNQQNALWSDFTPLFPVVLTEVSPGAGGSLAFTDAAGLMTSIEVPPGGVNEAVTMTFNPTDVGEMLFKYQLAGKAFALQGFSSSGLVTATLQAPLTITIEYAEPDVQRLVEDELQLYHQPTTGSGWQDAAGTCSPPGSYERYADENWFAVPACEFGRYALPEYTATIFLPLNRFADTSK